MKVDNAESESGVVVMLSCCFTKREKEALERDAGEKERGRATLSRKEASGTLPCLTCLPNA